MEEAKELHRKHRPEFFDDVIGQPEIVKHLQAIIARNDVHCFVFDGPSGTGKTTLARIVAEELNCGSSQNIEVDAATHSGADDMRAVRDALSYRPFGAKPNRAVIIDECQSLSKQAWQTLLKATEEPPAHVYWFFCTTEAGKIPPTIRTRGASFKLKLVDDALLGKHCERICKIEKIKLASGVQDVLVKSANGSPRQLLVNLAIVRESVDRKSAASALKVVMDTDATLKLAQMLTQGQKPSWLALMATFEDVKDENPEGIRIMIMRYLAKATASAGTNEKALKLLEKMEAFERPYNDSEGSAPLLLSLGRALL